MQYEFHPSVHPFNPFYGIANRPMFNVDPGTAWTVDSARLRHEKDILENGLADCVTYLHALRKKQARLERLLGSGVILTRKKRKQMLQRKYELDREIKNRQRDENAFLNNLQTCKINIHLAEGLTYAFTGPPSAVTDYISGTTQFSCEASASTEMSWNGWTEDTVVSPFEKTHSKKSFSHELAPDELEDLPTTAVPPNPIQSQRIQFPLSPGATIFKPSIGPAERGDKPRVSLSHTFGSRSVMPAKRYTEAEISNSLQGLSLDKTRPTHQVRNHTRCRTTSQRSLQVSGVMRRTKTNPL
jgi:hypothetical protein